jgi:cytochrome c6
VCYIPSGDFLVLRQKAARVVNQLAKSSFLCLIFSYPPALAATSGTGSELFQASCVGCHAGGGNVVPFSGEKGTLKLSALKKYDSATIDSMSKLILKGRNGMPAFGEFTSSKGGTIPARYSEEQVKDIAQFVLDQANAGWP